MRALYFSSTGPGSPSCDFQLFLPPPTPFDISKQLSNCSAINLITLPSSLLLRVSSFFSPRYPSLSPGGSFLYCYGHVREIGSEYHIASLRLHRQRTTFLDMIHSYACPSGKISLASCLGWVMSFFSKTYYLTLLICSSSALSSVSLALCRLDLAIVLVALMSGRSPSFFLPF